MKHLYPSSIKKFGSKQLAVFLCCLLCLSLNGQVNNQILEFSTVSDTIRQKEVYLKIQSLAYNKNNEYSGHMADGFTLFGYHLNPSLGYKLTPYISMEAGIFVNKDFGNNRYTQLLPTYTLRYHKKNLKVLFGNLDGSLRHNLVEPLYNFERFMTNRLENGFQIVYNTKHFDIDFWLDWLRMSYRYGMTENMWVGFNMNLLKYSTPKWEFSLPIQNVTTHDGGQLDTLPDAVVSQFNFSGGTRLKYKTGKKIVEEIGVDIRYLALKRDEFSRGGYDGDFGSGLLASLNIKAIGNTDLQITYWNGDNFYTDLGGDLYTSKSRTVAYPNYYERYREILILRLSNPFHLAEGVRLLLRAEPYYDLRNKWFEYSTSFYVVIDSKFWLKTKNPLSLQD